MASQYLAPGDTILEIDKMDARTLTQFQVDEIISRPGTSLDLLILKGEGVVSPYQPSSKFNFSRSVGSPDSTRSPSSRGYVSGDSHTDSSTSYRRNLQDLKDSFWSRIKNDKSEFFKEGFTDTGRHSPYKDRSPRKDQWRRCQSEEKGNFKTEEKYSSLFSDNEQSTCSVNPSRIQSVWSPTPDRYRTPLSDYWSQDEKTPTNETHHQDTTLRWQDSSERQRSSRSGSFSKSYKRHNSDYTYGYSSLSSEYASTPQETSNYPESSFKFEESFMKKPSDFWSDRYRDQQGQPRLTRLKSPPPFTKDSILKNTNVSSKSEFKKSVSIKESYSSSDGQTSKETYEHTNKTKETEKSSKSVDGEQERFVEKTKKNKEYIFANKDEVDGKPKETKKVINDFKLIEKVMDGEHEYCNKTKERSEEVTDSSTPVNFYDNVQQDVGEKSEKQNSSTHNGGNKYGETSFNKGTTDTISMQPPSQLDKDLQGNRASSTPVSSAGNIEEPLLENYLEVDIRTSLKPHNTYTSKEEILR